MPGVLAPGYQMPHCWSIFHYASKRVQLYKRLWSDVDNHIYQIWHNFPCQAIKNIDFTWTWTDRWTGRHTTTSLPLLVGRGVITTTLHKCHDNSTVCSTVCFGYQQIEAPPYWKSTSGGGFPSQRAINAEKVFMSWHYHYNKHQQSLPNTEVKCYETVIWVSY